MILYMEGEGGNVASISNKTITDLSLLLGINNRALQYTLQLSRFSILRNSGNNSAISRKMIADLFLCFNS